MNRLVAKAREFYSPELEPGEEIRQVRYATASGTGSKIVLGASIGALLGWLLAFIGDLALLPPFVLGAFAGEFIGYMVAHRRATSATGPGAIHLELVLTSNRLFTAKRYALMRRGILRAYPFAEISDVTTKRYPVGKYHRIDVSMNDGDLLSVVSDGPMDIPVNTGRGSR